VVPPLPTRPTVQVVILHFATWRSKWLYVTDEKREEAGTLACPLPQVVRAPEARQRPGIEPVKRGRSSKYEPIRRTSGHRVWKGVRVPGFSGSAGTLPTRTRSREAGPESVAGIGKQFNACTDTKPSRGTPCTRPTATRRCLSDECNGVRRPERKTSAPGTPNKSLPMRCIEPDGDQMTTDPSQLTNFCATKAARVRQGGRL
jgi:hypothetical protein